MMSYAIASLLRTRRKRKISRLRISCKESLTTSKCRKVSVRPRDHLWPRHFWRSCACRNMLLIMTLRCLAAVSEPSGRDACLPAMKIRNPLYHNKLRIESRFFPHNNGGALIAGLFPIHEIKVFNRTVVLNDVPFMTSRTGHLIFFGRELDSQT